MSSKTFPVGVAGVQIPEVSATTLPTFAGLTFTASGHAYTKRNLNGAKRALDVSASYQVILTLLGIDETNNGYTVGPGSPNSGTLTLSAGQGILISIDNADLPSGIAEAFAVGIWLKTGSGNFQLADFAYLDPTTDFKHFITAKPLRGSLIKTDTVLQASTVDDDLGDREPKGVIFRTLSPTTGGVNITRANDSVEFSPDNAGNFSAATTRTASISFALLAGDVEDIVAANAGEFVRYTSDTVVYEEAQMSPNTTNVFLGGNGPLILNMPPDNQGFQTVRMYLGQLLQNQEGNEESYTKDGQLVTNYSYNAVPMDTLTDGMNTELHWKKKA